MVLCARGHSGTYQYQFGLEIDSKWVWYSFSQSLLPDEQFFFGVPGKGRKGMQPCKVFHQPSCSSCTVAIRHSRLNTSACRCLIQCKIIQYKGRGWCRKLSINSLNWPMCISGELSILQEELHFIIWLVSSLFNFFICSLMQPCRGHQLNNINVVFGVHLRVGEYMQGISASLPAAEASSVMSAPHVCAFMSPYPACIDWILKGTVTGLSVKSL